MTMILSVMALGIALLLGVFFVLARRSNPFWAPLAVIPLAFTPLFVGCVFAAQTVIDGFRGMAAGEAGSMTSALEAISRANEFVLAAQVATGAVLLLVAAFTFTAIGTGLRSGAEALSSLGVIALAGTSVVVLGALTLSHVAARAVSFPLAVIASDNGRPIEDPDLPRTRKALEDLGVEGKDMTEVGATIAGYLIAAAVGSFVLLLVSVLSFVLSAVSLGKATFARSLGIAGLSIAVLGAAASAAGFVRHRALAGEIARVRGSWEAPSSSPANFQAATPEEGKELVAPVKIRDVAPLYPEEAVRARVEGQVVVEAVIDVQGNVQEVRVIESVPLLDASASRRSSSGSTPRRRWRESPVVS
jgi:hypothetical protein